MTGKHLKIVAMGDAVLGVRLEGNPNKPEPIHFRVTFPGGDMDIVRTTDNQYWCHVHVNNSKNGDYMPGDQQASITNARLDIHGKDTNKTDKGDFKDPDLYHLAVKISCK